jgi:Uma2 family endonuclease
MPVPKPEHTYSYADYVTWPEDEKWEILSGIPYMQAAPSWQHQSISMELSKQFAVYLTGKSCRVFAAPFDVCLAEYNENDDDIRTVVQPDIAVVCDETKLRKTGYFGVPQLIIEVSSPATSRRDKVLKFNLYEKAGVKEYWIVEPDGKFVNVFTLQENKRYGRTETYTDEDTVKVSIFPDLEIDLRSVFPRE